MKARKGLALILSVAMILSMLSLSAFAADEETAPAAPAMADAADSWASGSIDRWAQLGIVQGDSNGNFNPANPLSRGELATILVKMFGLTEKAPNTYADLKGDEWYADAILKCTAAGIMKGDGAKCNATAQISRQETMVMFGRAVGVVPADKPDMSKFTDGADVADWAAGYMAPLAEMGIITGGGDGSVTPAANIDRASMMALLDKAVVEYVNAPGEVTVDNANGFVVVNVSAKEGEVVVSGKAAGMVVAAGTAEGKVVAKDLVADTVKVDGTAAVSIEGKSTVGDVTVNAAAPVVIAKGVKADTVAVNAPAEVTNNGTVKNLEANAAATVTNNGSITTLTANAAVKVDNKGTISKAEVKADDVVLGGKKPTTVDVADGTKNPTNEKGQEIKDNTSSGNGGGGSVTPSHDAIENVSVNFLYFKPDSDNNIIIADFESDYRSALGSNYTIDEKSLTALKALDEDKDGKVTLASAETVFFNLPWACVRYTTYEENVAIALTYQKDGKGATFVNGVGELKDGDKSDNFKVEKTGAHTVAYEIKDDLGQSANVYGNYEFTLTGTYGEAKTIIASNNSDFYGNAKKSDITVKNMSADIFALYAKEGSGFEVNLPKQADFGTMNYAQTGNRINVTGTLAYVGANAQMGGFGDGENEGFYALYQFTVPAGMKDITINTGNKTFGASALDNNTFSLITFLGTKAPFKADAQLVVDFDGVGTEYAASTYTIDFSGLEIAYAQHIPTAVGKANMSDTAVPPVADNAQLAADYAVALGAKDSDGAYLVTISAKDLLKHTNGADNLGYWIGFGAIAPEGTTKVKAAVASTLDELNAKELSAEKDPDVNFDSQFEDGTSTGWTFYFDAGKNTTAYAKVVWMKGASPIGQTIYKVDLSGVKTLSDVATSADGITNAFVKYNTVTIEGSVTLDKDVKIADGKVLEIAEGATLVVPADKKLTIEAGGNVTGSGTWDITGTLEYIAGAPAAQDGPKYTPVKTLVVHEGGKVEMNTAEGASVLKMFGEDGAKIVVGKGATHTQVNDGETVVNTIKGGTVSVGTGKDKEKGEALWGLETKESAVIEAGATLEVVGTLNNAGGTITNNGTLIINGTLTNSGTLTNNGTIEVNDGAGLVTAFSAGGMIKVGSDFDLEQRALLKSGTATLDLNGNTITLIAKSSGLKVIDDGVLTLTDTGSEGKITVSNVWKKNGVGMVEANDGGTFKMEGGIIDATFAEDDTATQAQANGAFAVTLFNDTTFIMDGGKIQAGWYCVSTNGTIDESKDNYGNNAKITINDGELISTGDFAIYGPALDGTVAINGGTIKGDWGAVQMKRGTLTIADGDFATTGDGTNEKPSDQTDGSTPDGVVTISQDKNYGTVTVSITGGTYSADVTDYCEDGYVCTGSGTTWTVAKSTPAE